MCCILAGQDSVDAGIKAVHTRGYAGTMAAQIMASQGLKPSRHMQQAPARFTVTACGDEYLRAQRPQRGTSPSRPTTGERAVR